MRSSLVEIRKLRQGRLMSYYRRNKRLRLRNDCKTTRRKSITRSTMQRQSSEKPLSVSERIRSTLILSAISEIDDMTSRDNKRFGRARLKRSSHRGLLLPKLR